MGSTHYVKWTAFMFLLSAIIAYKISIVNKLYALAFVGICFSYLRVMALSRGLLIDTSNPHISLLFWSSHSFICFLLVCFALLILDNVDWEDVLESMPFICFTCSLMIIYQYCIGSTGIYSGGLWNSPSVSGTFIGIMSPLVLRKSLGFYLVCLLAITLTQSAMAVVTAVSALVFFKMFQTKIWEKLIYLVGTTAWLIFMYFFKYQFFHHSGRLSAWKAILAFADDWNTPLIGTGMGTWQIYNLSDDMQALAGTFENQWTWIHNDLLQLHVEGGPILLAVCVLIWGFAILSYLSQGRNYHAAAVFAVAPGAFGNYPFHAPGQGFFIGVLFLSSLQSSSWQKISSYLQDVWENALLSVRGFLPQSSTLLDAVFRKQD